MPTETDAEEPARQLASLQRAWTLTQPFHNLDLLAEAGPGGRPLGRTAALARCAAQLGGPCHVQSWGFLTHLRRKGLDARLSGATISQPDDHLVVLVHIGGRGYLCDVGNGQPYLEPFPLDRRHSQAHLGWEVRSTPVDGGLTVERRSPDQPAWRTVYHASLEERRWEDFADTIARHHREPGFGPFLSGLRVVRIGPTAMTTVRDDQVTTYHPEGFTRRQLPDRELVRFIIDELGLGGLPVSEAVATWRDSRRRVA